MTENAMNKGWEETDINQCKYIAKNLRQKNVIVRIVPINELEWCLCKMILSIRFHLCIWQVKHFSKRIKWWTLLHVCSWKSSVHFAIALYIQLMCHQTTGSYCLQSVGMGVFLFDHLGQSVECLFPVRFRWQWLVNSNKVYLAYLMSITTYSNT